MTHNEISPDEAARALSEVAGRRRQVAAAVSLPAWYWPAGGVIALLGGVWGDLPVPPTVSVVGELLTGLAMLAVVGLGVFRQSVRPDPALFGFVGWLLTMAVVPLFGVAILAVVFGTAEFVATADVPLPGTTIGLVMGVFLAVGGPLVERLQQRIRIWLVR